jgi:hypothetical protein
MQEKINSLEKRLITLEVKYDGIHEIMCELKEDVKKGFEDTNKRFMKALGIIIGLLLSISGALIYKFIVENQ